MYPLVIEHGSGKSPRDGAFIGKSSINGPFSSHVWLLEGICAWSVWEPILDPTDPTARGSLCKSPDGKDDSKGWKTRCHVQRQRVHRSFQANFGPSTEKCSTKQPLSCTTQIQCKCQFVRVVTWISTFGSSGLPPWNDDGNLPIFKWIEPFRHFQQMTSHSFQ